MTIPYGRQSIDERRRRRGRRGAAQRLADSGPGRGRVRGRRSRKRATRRTPSRSPRGRPPSTEPPSPPGWGRGRARHERDHLLGQCELRRVPRSHAAFRGHRPGDVERDARSRWRSRSPTARAPWCPVHFAGLPAPIAGDPSCGGRRRRRSSRTRPTRSGADGRASRSGPVAHSDMAMFSLHPVKAIDHGRGRRGDHRDPETCGTACASSATTASRSSRRMRHEGGWYREQRVLGFNYRLSDIHAPLGRSQLGKLRSFVARRNEVAGALPLRLPADVPELALPPSLLPGATHAYHLFVVRPPRGRPGRRQALRRPPGARNPRSGPLRPGLPAPLLPRDLRLWPRALSGSGGLLLRLSVAALLPRADGRPAGCGGGGDTRGTRGMTATPEFRIADRSVGGDHDVYVIAEAGAEPQPRPGGRTRADRRRRRRRSRRGQVPDLLGRTALLDARRQFEYLEGITDKSPSELLEDIALPREWQGELADYAAAPRASISSRRRSTTTPSPSSTRSTSRC